MAKAASDTWDYWNCIDCCSGDRRNPIVGNANRDAGSGSDSAGEFYQKAERIGEKKNRKVKDRWGSHRSFEGSINN